MTSYPADSGGESEPGESGSGWRRSSRCGSSSCVEVAIRGDAIAVRDSKRLDGPVLTYSREEWLAFVAGVKGGEFDLA
jgi:hypothetical protein